LLEYSRVSTQTKPFEVVSLDGVLDEALETLEARLEETGATVTRDPLPEIAADRMQLVQLFQNLIGNGLKFAREDVRPEIRVCAEEGVEGGVTLRVSDNGIGIDPRHVERLFQPFTRLNPRSAYEGSGIGLSICRKIVERHYGTIAVEHRDEPGTTFRVQLPSNGVTPGSSKHGIHKEEQDGSA
jgi:signal transduction histidine kinase